jgi:hypothetical protein
MKTCQRCGRNPELSEFNWKNRAKGTLQSFCNSCRRRYVRDHYLQNQTDTFGKANARNVSERVDRRHRLLEFWWALLEFWWADPCVDCGQQHPIELQLNRPDRSLQSTENAVRLRRGLSWRRIKAEIDNCLARCANCHQRRAARHFGWYRLWSVALAPVAQRIEHQPSKLGVGGSSPSGRTLGFLDSHNAGCRTACQVESLRGHPPRAGAPRAAPHCLSAQLVTLLLAAMCLVIAPAVWPPAIARAAPIDGCIAGLPVDLASQLRPLIQALGDANGQSLECGATTPGAVGSDAAIQRQHDLQLIAEALALLAWPTQATATIRRPATASRRPVTASRLRQHPRR